MKHVSRHVVGAGENAILVAANERQIIIRQETFSIVLTPDQAEQLSEAIMLAGAASIRARKASL